MKEHYIALFKINDEVTDFFLVNHIAVKVGSNKKQFLDLLLADNSGEISAKKWDVANEELDSLNEIKLGDFVKIKASVTEWNGMKQLKVMKVRKAVDQDELDKKDYIKAAPEDPEDMYEFLLAKANGIEDSDYRKLSTYLLETNKDELMYYPAASSNHHAELAGLLYHIKRMLIMGEKVCEVYTELNRDMIITGVIMHDIEKLTEMISDENGVVSEYSFEGQMLGHLVQGVKLIDKLADEWEMPYEKKIMLEHMMISHHYEPEFGSPKRPLFPEAEILHYLDIMDARVYDMDEALYGVEPGKFSDRVWTLNNRRLYKYDGNKTT